MAALLMVLVALLGACSPDDRAPMVNAPRGEVAEGVADYAGCLKDEGLEVRPPRFDSEGRVASWPEYDATEASEAEAACKDLIADVALPEMQEQDDFIARAEGFIQCLRDEGVAAKALPHVESEGLILPRRSRKDPNFKKAESKCLPLFEEDL